jgi:hypothetical protein
MVAVAGLVIKVFLFPEEIVAIVVAVGLKRHLLIEVIP